MTIHRSRTSGQVRLESWTRRARGPTIAHINPQGRISMERRRNRSEIVGTALDLFLKSSADRSQIGHLVLSDEHGLLVASNRTGKSAGVLAMLGRLKAQGQSTPRYQKLDSSKLGVHCFETQRQKLYLSWAGTTCLSAARLNEAENAVRRILLSQ